MNDEQTAFQIDIRDNVATVLTEVSPGKVKLLGDASFPQLEASTKVPVGHKLALRDIKSGEDIIKYGVVIGRATADIPKGAWVHLHVMKSIYDQRSSHLDIRTGAPKDTKYE
jgi:altronate dehydratase small subunit